MRELYLVVALAACYAPAPQPGAPCAEGDVCPTGLRCIDKVCQTSGSAGDASIDVGGDAGEDGAVDAALTGIQFVHGAYSDSQISTTMLTLAMPQPSTAGHLRLVFVSWQNGVGFQGITDDQGGTYVELVNPPGGMVRIALYAAPVVTAGTTTITAKWNNAAASPELRVVEYRGVDLQNPIAYARRNGGTGTACSAPVPVAVGNVVVAGNAADMVPTTAVGTGFIERQRTIFGGNIIEDLHASQGGMVDAASTLAASASWQVAAVVLQ